MHATDKPLLACLLDGSRMSREVHVRFCERPVVKSRRPTHPGFFMGSIFSTGSPFSKNRPRVDPACAPPRSAARVPRNPAAETAMT